VTRSLMSVSVRTAIAIALALTMSSLARATVLVPVELPELTSDAAVVVRGTVVATEARWLDGRRGIETIVTLAAGDYLKGNLGRSPTFRVPGGQIGPYRSIMVGAPVFREGDDVVLFLSASGAAEPHIVGFNQGVYRVRADVAGRPVVEPPGEREGLSQPSAADRAASRAPATRPARAHEPVSVFLARVRALVAARGGR